MTTQSPLTIPSRAAQANENGIVLFSQVSWLREVALFNPAVDIRGLSLGS
jgi:hypothetical protein